MAQDKRDSHFVFPKWTNLLLPVLAVGIVGGGLWAGTLVPLLGSPRSTDIGYMPEQPVPYSHALHVGKLGMDCTYCHTTVDQAAFAAIPPTQTCMNCHSAIHNVSAGVEGDPNKIRNTKMQPVIDSYRTGDPIEWIKVHDLPDYAYFSHQAHVSKGVGCNECHGRVDKMEVVWQVEELSMRWCIDCHREPDANLRPIDQVTNLGWGIDLTASEVAQLRELGLTDVKVGDELTYEQRMQLGGILKKDYQIKTARQLQDCSVCHR